MEKSVGFTAALRVRDIRFFLGAIAFFTFAGRALLVIIGLQVYRLTHNPMALGWLGLIEAIPAISLVLFGGYVADHFNRKKILLITVASSFVCTLTLAVLSWHSEHSPLASLYTVVFLIGFARGFADPAATAFEAQVVPQHLTVNAGAWVSSTWITCNILGPAAVGFMFDAWGSSKSFLFLSGFFLLAWLCTLAITSKPLPAIPHKEPVLKSISSGWKFVFRNQTLFAALSLDLFAVLFGGTMALLPIYADSILHVGAKGLGLLNAATYAGALIISFITTRYTPMGNAGRNLLVSVFGFGICILIFAFSKNFILSLFALFMSGVFDGISVVIRRSMVRLLSPETMRGRVAAANWIFITASNEIGAFESGFLAALIGTIPCVAVGGVVTLGIVAAVATFAPQLRRLRFNPKTLEQIP